MSLMLLKRAAISLNLDIKLGLGAFTTPQQLMARGGHGPLEC